MKKKNFSLLNTIIKTIISVILVVLFWWFVHKLIGPIIVETTFGFIITNIIEVFFVFSCLYLLWTIFPYDTKVWIKNWKKEDFVKTGTALSFISTIIKIPLSIIVSIFLAESIFILCESTIFLLPILILLDIPIVKYILIIVIFYYILPGDIKYWIKQWNK